MAYVLNSRERQALSRMEIKPANFHIDADLGSGVGSTTVQSLLKLGLIEEGPSERHYGRKGWRITQDGWRCMYGKTLEEITAAGKPVRPLQVWRWPAN